MNNSEQNVTSPRYLQELYDSGVNISAFLREQQGILHNTESIIEIAYDLQSGSYIASTETPEGYSLKERYTSEIANVILSLLHPASVLEAGVGEATTLSGVLKHLKIPVEAFGFDISWSRVAYGQKYLEKQGISNVTLCTGSLLSIPFADESIDIVYTSHSIEPNRGKEKPILKELLRVARKYLILLEPGYELASDEARKRMDFHGYCRNLKETVSQLGYKVLVHELFPVTGNPLNPTAITIIEKEVNKPKPPYILACPKFKTRLEKIDNVLFSLEGLMIYPIIDNIPCLRVENGIIATHYKKLHT